MSTKKPGTFSMSRKHEIKIPSSSIQTKFFGRFLMESSSDRSFIQLLSLFRTRYANDQWVKVWIGNVFPFWQWKNCLIVVWIHLVGWLLLNTNHLPALNAQWATHIPEWANWTQNNVTYSPVDLVSPNWFSCLKWKLFMSLLHLLEAALV